jgi:hypothetical protein
MGYLYKNMKKYNWLPCWVLLFFYTFGSNYSRKNSWKTTELNEVTIIKTKKSDRAKADRTIFNFADQPNLNTGSVLEGIKNYLV